MKDGAILVVIPHYGKDEVLSRLLLSLGVSLSVAEIVRKRTTILPFSFGEICIVNNNLGNAGFTKACNEGIRYGLDKGFSAIWLLNNDTVVPDVKAAISAFLGEFNAHTKTGVIGCKMLSLADPDLIHHAGTEAVLPGGVHKHGRVSLGEYETRTLEKWVTGASMVVSRACLRETGLLDEFFFNYASDSDYCYRARLAGFDVVYLPVPIMHAIGQSSDPNPEQFQVLEHDRGYFKNKWIDGGVFGALDAGA